MNSSSTISNSTYKFDNFNKRYILNVIKYFKYFYNWFKIVREKNVLYVRGIEKTF